MQTIREIFPVSDPSFSKYGRVVTGYGCPELLEALGKTEFPDRGTVYAASDASLERLPVFKELQEREFGGLPIQLGYCNGNNHKLNALEYHRSSEVNIAGTDLILLVGLRQDMDPDDFTYDTSLVRAFLVPAGTMAELYATTLHYAPCTAAGRGFYDAVALPRGTNLALGAKPAPAAEDRLLFARNKWLIAHPESGLGAEGAFPGLKGENIPV